MVRVKAGHFADPLDVSMFTVINDEVQKCKGLVKGDLVLCGFTSYTVHNVGLQSKPIGKNGHDNGSFLKLRKPEYDATCLEDHWLTMPAVAGRVYCITAILPTTLSVPSSLEANTR